MLELVAIADSVVELIVTAVRCCTPSILVVCFFLFIVVHRPFRAKSALLKAFMAPVVSNRTTDC